MDATAHARCPYCGETIELVLDTGGGDEQTYIEDCEVCCRPIQVEVTRDARGSTRVRLSRSD